jgi:hypothetical protein
MSKTKQSSYFNLPTHEETLATVDHLDSAIRQVSSDRNISGSNFNNGSISYTWSGSADDKWWIPSKSYLRLRCKLTKPNGDPLNRADGIALAQNAGALLFDNVEFMIGGKTVCQTTHLLPEVETLRNRMTKSQGWMEGCGGASGLWGSYAERLNLTSGDKPPAKGLNTLQWKVVGSAAGLTVGSDMTWTKSTRKLTLVGLGTADTPNCSELFKIGDRIWNKGTSVTNDQDIDGIVEGFDPLDGTTLILTNERTVPDFALKSIGGTAGDLTTGELYVERTVKYDNDVYSNEIELVFSPPVSLFHSIKHAIPRSGKMELRMHPSNSYKYHAVESRGFKAGKPGSAVADTYDFQVESMDLFLFETRSARRFEGSKYYLDLHEIDANSVSVTSNSLVSLPFHVDPKTRGLTVAYSDERIATDTRCSAALFKSYGLDSTDNPARAVGEVDAFSGGQSSSNEADLNQFQLHYANKVFPAVQADNSISVGKDFFRQRFKESQIYQGIHDHSVQLESYEQWKDRGMYMYFDIDKDKKDDNTTVSVVQSFANASRAFLHRRIIVFSHTRSVVTVAFNAVGGVSEVIRQVV